MIAALTAGSWSLWPCLTCAQSLAPGAVHSGRVSLTAACAVFPLPLSSRMAVKPDIEDPYDCKKCRMSFPTLQDHRKHIHEVHSKEYHPCPTCGKIFSAPSMLERHMVTHVGGKPFSCGICNKAYQVTVRSAGSAPPTPTLSPACPPSDLPGVPDVTMRLPLVKVAACNYSDSLR